MKIHAKRTIFLILILFFLTPTNIIQAEEQKITDEMIEKQINTFDYSDIEAELSNNKNMPIDYSFSGIVSKAIKGEMDLSPTSLINTALHMLFKELYENGALIKNLIIIALLGAILKNLTESFKNKSVGELGFYVTYVSLVGVLFSSFFVTTRIIQDLIESLSSIMMASIPLMTSLLFMSGNVSGAYAFQALLALTVNGISVVIVNAITPLILLAASIKIINYLTEKEILSNFADLIQKTCSWSLKGLAGAFIAILSLQRISVPILNNLVTKTAKTAINAVPVVGGALSGAIDSVTFWISATKSGISVALIIVVLIACAIPFIKLVALIATYKITAALIQPVCDPRIVKCIDAVGTFSLQLLGAGVTVMVMFVFSIMILLSF